MSGGIAMFETLQDQMKIDERRATTTQARVVFWLTIAVLSIILFSALYFGILLLQGS
jgi:hypothetical protein